MKLGLMIPDSYGTNFAGLREKTHGAGLIARASAIFGVDEVHIYPEDPSSPEERNVETIADLLRYAETPQYLRKELFPKRSHLSYVGTLPPLRAPHHKRKESVSELILPQFREGVAYEDVGDGFLVDVGLDHPAVVDEAELGERLTVKIQSFGGELLRAETAERGDAYDYWGYSVRVWNRGFGDVVREVDPDTAIFTSRKGDPIEALWTQLGAALSSSTSVAVVFGGPASGLLDLHDREALASSADRVFILNTVPGQRTETVRTEEAVLVTLGGLNVCERI